MDPDKTELTGALAAAHDRATRFFSSLDARPPARPYAPGEPARLPDEGVGAEAAITALWDRFGDTFSGSSGPRYWGYVHGGVTPAAIAADWIAAAVDQTGQMHGDSPSVAIERETMAMLRDLFALPDEYHGMFVSGGSMANYTGLAIGLQRVGERFGVDVSREGVAALPPIRVLTGECHASVSRACGMLGLGRNAVDHLPLELGRERVSIPAMSTRLRELRGHPVIIVGNAGTVTTGDCDDLGALADLAGESDAHLHVDGAFGLFAQLTDRTSALTSDIGRADTIASDAHKWLNVPYDSGLLFSRHLDAQTAMFKNESLYLPPPTVDPLNFPNLGPENSRRLRALPAWATLQAYGREGYRRFVGRCCALASELGERIDAEPGFRLAAPVRLNVVCFQLVEGGVLADAGATKQFVEALIEDGRVRVSTSMLNGEACVRLAILNWRTGHGDLDIAMEAFRAFRDKKGEE